MKPKPGDILLAAVMALTLLFLSFAATGMPPPGFGFLKSPEQGRIAQVTLDQSVLFTIALDQAGEAGEGREYRVEKDGRLLSLLSVRDGKIRFTWSDCPDQVCVHTGWIGWSGQAAVCLPNRVMVQIRGESDESGDDADVYLR